jgi:hypothetical protein
MAAILGVAEQLVDQLRAPVGILAVENRNDFFRRRNLADDIQIRTAQKLRIVGRAGGADRERVGFRGRLPRRPFAAPARCWSCSSPAPAA